MKFFGPQIYTPASLPWSDRLVSKLNERDYRHAYMVEGVKNWIARQVRALREKQDWSQGDLGRRMGKPQSAISRIEDPDYGKLTLQTLFDLARAYDLPLLVQFVEWSDWLFRMNDVSTRALERDSYDERVLSDFGAGQVSLPSMSGLIDYGSVANVDAVRSGHLVFEEPDEQDEEVELLPPPWMHSKGNNYLTLPPLRM